MDTSEAESESAEPRVSILVIDGEAQRRALVALLEKRFRVVEAADVARALEVVDGGGIEMVLLGIDMFAQLRKQGEAIQRQLEELRALDALKDDLVSLVAHDLRNPLAGLSVLLHSVARDVGDPDLERDLSAALNAADRLRDTIDDMLEVRLLEEGKVTLEKRAMSARTVVTEAIATLAEVAAERSLSIEEQTESDVVLDLDTKLVRRSIENLIANAIKYSPDNGVIRVFVRGRDEGVEIEVADTGPGIPDSLKSSLFQKFGFASVDQAGRRGFGMGLYLVNLVATLHGGRVGIEDREGGGARFLLFFPRR